MLGAIRAMEKIGGEKILAALKDVRSNGQKIIFPGKIISALESAIMHIERSHELVGEKNVVPVPDERKQEDVRGKEGHDPQPVGSRKSSARLSFRKAVCRGLVGRGIVKDSVGEA